MALPLTAELKLGVLRVSISRYQDTSQVQLSLINLTWLHILFFLLAVLLFGLVKSVSSEKRRKTKKNLLGFSYLLFLLPLCKRSVGEKGVRGLGFWFEA